MTIILYLLPHKTQGTVAVLSVVLFLLLLVAVWILLDSLWLRVGAALTLAIAVLIFSNYVWPTESITPLTRLNQIRPSFHNLAWYWFALFGCMVGIPLGMALQCRGRTLMKETIAERLYVRERQLNSAKTLKKRDDEKLQSVTDEFGRVLIGIGTSLDAYFAAINNFADSQLEAGKWRIDELTDKIKGSYAAKARLTLDQDSSLTIEQKETVLRELAAAAVTESNDGSEKKAAMTQSASRLKEKNQEIRRAYTAIENAWEQIAEAITMGMVGKNQAAELAKRLNFLEEETRRFVENINLSRNTNNT